MKKMTRKEKRSAYIEIDGKRLTVMEFLAQRAKDLPPVTDRETGHEIDHSGNLKKLYMTAGSGAVDEYIRRVHAVSLRDSGESIIQRMKGRAMVIWQRVKGTGL